MKDSYKILLGRHKRKRQLGRWEDSIKMDLKGMGPSV
jgi:hypothetical protein